MGSQIQTAVTNGHEYFQDIFQRFSTEQCVRLSTSRLASVETKLVQSFGRLFLTSMASTPLGAMLGLLTSSWRGSMSTTSSCQGLPPSLPEDPSRTELSLSQNSPSKCSMPRIRWPPPSSATPPPSKSFSRESQNSLPLCSGGKLSCIGIQEKAWTRWSSQKLNPT